MHDGANARAWVHVRVREGVSNLLLESFRDEKADEVKAAGKQKVFTRFLTRAAEAPRVLAIDSAAYRRALDARPQIFEPLHDLPLFAAHNELRFYTWGARECCLPKGATRATLRGRFPDLKPGYVLILTEVLGPQTGQPADADPARRHAVRLSKVTPGEDPVGGRFDDPATHAPVHVTEIEWLAEDALPFALCVSSRVGTEFYPDVSVALGNVVLADHGLTVEGERLPEVPGANPALTKVAPRAGDRCEDDSPELTPPRYRPRLKGAPLTQAAPFDFADASVSATAAMGREVRKLLPAVSLDEEGVSERWRPRRDLLSSAPGAREFVAETERDGVTYLRFGDGRFGSRPAEGAQLTATYRVGNGEAGNVGADSLVHVASNDPAVVTDLTNSPLVSVRNPLAARGGAEPEALERVRQDAPEAFRTQERAVTTDDYAEAARTRCGAGVQRAAATMRWTGSWHTVFVTADRFGGGRVDEKFQRSLRRCLERFRMAGHDLEVEAPSFVPLEVGMTVCVKRGYLTSDVRRALLEKFSSRTSPGGERGLFHPDNFSFGQPVFLSALYAAAQSVAGVDSVDITVFQRRGAPASTTAGAAKASRARRPRASRTAPGSRPSPTARAHTRSSRRRCWRGSPARTRARCAPSRRAPTRTSPSPSSTRGRSSPTCSPSTRSGSPTSPTCGRRPSGCRWRSWRGSSATGSAPASRRASTSPSPSRTRPARWARRSTSAPRRRWSWSRPRPSPSPPASRCRASPAPASRRRPTRRPRRSRRAPSGTHSAPASPGRSR
jgi:hypothetical protein